MMKEIPKHWITDGIEPIERLAPNATVVIAGGAALSLFEPEYPVKDVDVFVLGPLPTQIKRLQKEYGFGWRPSSIEGAGFHGQQANFHRFINGVTYDTVILEDVFTPAELFQGFDINMSRVAVDADGSFYIDRSFETGLKNRRLVADNPKGNTASRLARYAKKLPGYEISGEAPF